MKKPFLQYIRILGVITGLQLSNVAYQENRMMALVWVCLSALWVWLILNDLCETRESPTDTDRLIG